MEISIFLARFLGGFYLIFGLLFIVAKTLKINLSEKIQVLEFLGLKKASDKRYSKKHKFESETVVGERIGRDGKVAYVHQVINRTKNYYKKYVKQGNKVVKDVEGKLTEHK